LSIVLRASAGLGSPGDGLLHAIINHLYGVARNDGSDNGFGFQGIACRQSIGPSYKLAKKFVVNFALDDDSASIQPNLALMKERSERRRAHRVVHVHVVEDY